MSAAQRRMLSMVAHGYAGASIGEVVMEHSCDSPDNSLSWLNSNRTVGALLRRGLVRLESDEWLHITDEGRAALEQARGVE